MDKKNLDELKKQVDSLDYFKNPDRTQERQSDFSSLLQLIDDHEKRLYREKKKNEILQQQNMELTQQMESIRSDFGGDMR